MSLGQSLSDDSHFARGLLLFQVVSCCFNVPISGFEDVGRIQIDDVVLCVFFHIDESLCLRARTKGTSSEDRNFPALWTDRVALWVRFEGEAQPPTSLNSQGRE